MAVHGNLKPGDMFGRYRLDRFLGAGGFAVVWQAYDTMTQAVVALKIFSSLDTQSIQELAAEYASVHNLSHPSIVRAEYFDSLGNIPFLVMKYCSGGNLEHKEGRIGEAMVLEMMRQIADALYYVHAQGLVHQDIKPANILTEQTQYGTRFMLSDFGISAKSRTRLSKSVSGGAESGSYLTFAYAPPEKFSPRREDRLPNSKGDIFSLGITAYELATGYLPFDDIPTGQQLQNNPSLRLDYSAIRDPQLRQIIVACCDADPARRPAACQVTAWISQGSVPQTPSASKATVRNRVSYAPKKQVPQRKQHRNTGLRVFLSILGVSAFLVLGYFALYFLGFNVGFGNSRGPAAVENADEIHPDEDYNAAEIEQAIDSMAYTDEEAAYPYGSSDKMELTPIEEEAPADSVAVEAAPADYDYSK